MIVLYIILWEYFYLAFWICAHFLGTRTHELCAYCSKSSYLPCFKHKENSVIIENYIIIGYKLTAVLSILLLILSIEVKHILNIMLWLGFSTICTV